MRSLKESQVAKFAVRTQLKSHAEDFLHFWYLPEFESDWRSIFPNDDDEEGLWAAEIMIMSEPDRPPVVPGTGGLRKARFGKVGQDGRPIGGKRGGCRICYSYYPEHYSILMVMVYDKSYMDNISVGEKKTIRRILEGFKTFLDERR